MEILENAGTINYKNHFSQCYFTVLRQKIFKLSLKVRL